MERNEYGKRRERSNKPSMGSDVSSERSSEDTERNEDRHWFLGGDTQGTVPHTGGMVYLARRGGMNMGEECEHGWVPSGTHEVHSVSYSDGKFEALINVTVRCQHCGETHE